jgi:hypothetical protein
LGVAISGYSGQEDVVIPNYIHGIPVTQIRWGAFRYLGIRSVKLPENLRFINGGAFEGNFISSVVIPNNVVEIGSHAFRNNILTNVEIGESVVWIWTYAFAFNQLESIIIPKNVERIFSRTFQDNRLVKVSIGDSVLVFHDAFNHVSARYYNWGHSNFTSIYQGIGGTFRRDLANHTFWERVE